MPLIFAGAFTDTASVFAAGAAFVLFSAAASAGYLINDARDIDADRLHPRKRLRPIAAGRVSIRTAYLSAAVLLMCALGGSYLLAPLFALTVLAYVALTVSYSFFFKYILALDVVSIACGFVLRVIGGSFVIFVEPSEWLLGLTFLLALLLATGKRLQEISAAGVTHRTTLHYYTREVLLFTLAVELGVVGVAYVGYLFFAEKPLGLFATLPFAWAGLARYFVLIRDPAHATDGPTELFFADWLLQLAVVIWLGVTVFTLSFI